MGSSLQKWKLKMNMDEIEVIEVSTTSVEADLGWQNGWSKWKK